MRTIWKIACASLEGCADVKEKLSGLGFNLLEDTPKSAESDFIMSKDVAVREDALKEDEKIRRACGDSVQQILFSFVT